MYYSCTLAEDRSLVPNEYIRKFTTSYVPSSRGTNDFWTMLLTHITLHSNKHIHNIKVEQKESFKKWGPIVAETYEMSVQLALDGWLGDLILSYCHCFTFDKLQISVWISILSVYK